MYNILIFMFQLKGIDITVVLGTYNSLYEPIYNDYRLCHHTKKEEFRISTGLRRRSKRSRVGSPSPCSVRGHGIGVQLWAEGTSPTSFQDIQTLLPPALHFQILLPSICGNSSPFTCGSIAYPSLVAVFSESLTLTSILFSSLLSF